MYVYVDVGDELDEGQADNGRAFAPRLPGRDLLAVSAFALTGLAVALAMAAAFPAVFDLTALLILSS